MRITVKIGFWDEGVGCFCHEAVGRALSNAFEGLCIDVQDLAHEKYLAVSNNPKIEQSAWREYLRGGPRHTFTLPSGSQGWLSRYEIGFDLVDSANDTEIRRVREFIQGLKLGSFKVEESNV